MGKLVLLFTVVPLLDLWLLLAIGEQIGFWATIGLTIFTAVLGAYLAKREGRRVIAKWHQAVQALRVPEEGVLSGVLVLAGAVLLVAPGVLTDAMGILLLVPPTRRFVAGLLRGRLEHRFSAHSMTSGGFSVRVVDFSSVGGGAGRSSRDVIDVEGEAVDGDDEPKRLER